MGGFYLLDISSSEGTQNSIYAKLKYIFSWANLLLLFSIESHHYTYNCYSGNRSIPDSSFYLLPTSSQVWANHLNSALNFPSWSLDKSHNWFHSSNLDPCSPFSTKYHWFIWNPYLIPGPSVFLLLNIFRCFLHYLYHNIQSPWLALKTSVISPAYFSICIFLPSLTNTLYFSHTKLPKYPENSASFQI